MRAFVLQPGKDIELHVPSRPTGREQPALSNLSSSSCVMFLSELLRGRSEKESNTPKDRVRLRSHRIIVSDPLVSRLEYDLWRWEKRQTKILKSALPGTCRKTEVRAGNSGDLTMSDRLKVLIGLAIECDQCPGRRQDRSERYVQRNLSGVSVHEPADIVRGVSVVVRTQIYRVAEHCAHILSAYLHPRLRDAVAKFRIEHGEARVPERIAEIVVRSAGRGIWGVVSAHAPPKSRHRGRREVQLAGIGEDVAELAEIADYRPRESKRFQAGNARRIWYDQSGVGVGNGEGVGIGTQRKVIPEILEAAAQPELIFYPVHHRSIKAAGGHPPCRRDQAIVQFGTPDAVELRGLVMLVDVADRHEVDTG